MRVGFDIDDDKHLGREILAAPVKDSHTDLDVFRIIG